MTSLGLIERSPAKPLDRIFARFRHLLPPTKAWAGSLKLDVTESARGDLLVDGEDQNAPYGALQHHVSLTVRASEVPKLRVALDAHPLADLRQVVIQNAEVMFGGLFTLWLDQHWIEFELRESMIER